MTGHVACRGGRCRMDVVKKRKIQRPYIRPRCRREYNIKMGLKEIV
jgi:hypothetical protein